MSLRNKLFELRVYDVKPDCVPAYAAMTKEHFSLRTAHSPVCGFWATEVGGQNQFVHIWQYDSLTQRKDVRDALAGDKAWLETYLTPLRSMLVKQDNVVMEPTAEIVASEGRYYCLLQGDAVPQPTDAVQQCGRWRVVGAGDVGSEVALFSAESLDDFRRFEQPGCRGRIMLHAPFAAQYTSLFRPAV